MQLKNEEWVLNAGEILQMKWLEVCQNFCSNYLTARQLIEEYLECSDKGLSVGDFRTLYRHLLKYVDAMKIDEFKQTLFTCLYFEVKRGVSVPVGETDLA